MVSARIPELKDCGCGIPLVTGSKLISIVYFAISVLGVIAFTYIIISIEMESVDKDAYKEVMAGMGLIVSASYGSLAALLWFGIQQHNPSLVLPWAILTTAFTIIFTLMALIILLWHTWHFVNLIVWSIIVLLYYSCLIVYSHFRELRREMNLPASLNNTEEA